MTIASDRALWCGVIRQAFADATAPASTSSNVSVRAGVERIRSEAINWLTYPSKDFTEACCLAGFDPDYIRAKAKKIASGVREPVPSKTEKARKRIGPITYGDRTLTLSQWATEMGINKSTLCARFKYGWSIERILTTPARASNRGRALNIAQTSSDRCLSSAQESA